MKVAESIDREHIDEHWYEEYVCEEANSISWYILYKVNRTHDNRYCVDAEHYHTSKHQPREEIFTSIVPLFCVHIVVSFRWVK